MNIIPISFMYQAPAQSAVTASISTPYDQLNTITSYLRNYITEFRNPQFFLYRLDNTAYNLSLIHI